MLPVIPPKAKAAKKKKRPRAIPNASAAKKKRPAAPPAAAPAVAPVNDANNNEETVVDNTEVANVAKEAAASTNDNDGVNDVSNDNIATKEPAIEPQPTAAAPIIAPANNTTKPAADNTITAAAKGPIISSTKKKAPIKKIAKKIIKPIQPKKKK
eukprot:scaffold6970_cov82-Skeletonema_dohrnii-CCMP3373.AAC.3